MDNTSAITLVDTVPVANTLGESIVWNADDNAAWWTDIPQKRLFRYAPEEREFRHWPLPEPLCSFAFTTDNRWLICAFASGFAFYNPHNNELRWIAKPDANNPNVRLNDGRLDRQGRFWAGAKVESGDKPGNLYCLDHALACTQKETDIRIANGLAWSPEGTRMYFADSPTHEIRVYDFDAATAAISNRRIFARTETGIEPDGSTVDADGFLWNAQWAGGRVVRYAPDGSIDAVIKTPCAQPTCATFGGRDLQYLFVTSASDGLSPEALRGQPEAGHLFIYRTPYKGLLDRRFPLS